MKILLDVSNLSHEQITGIGVYTKNLHKHLQLFAGPSFYPICSLSRWHRRKHIEGHLSKTVYSSLIIPHLPSELRLLHVPDHRLTGMAADIRRTIENLGQVGDSEWPKSTADIQNHIWSKTTASMA